MKFYDIKNPFKIEGRTGCTVEKVADGSGIIVYVGNPMYFSYAGNQPNQHLSWVASVVFYSLSFPTKISNQVPSGNVVPGLWTPRNNIMYAFRGAYALNMRFFLLKNNLLKLFLIFLFTLSDFTPTKLRAVTTCIRGTC